MRDFRFRLTIGMGSFVLCCILAGCAAIQSTETDFNQSGSGLAYYLPKGILEIVVVQTINTPAAPVLTPPVQTNLSLTSTMTIHENSTTPANSVKYNPDNSSVNFDATTAEKTNTITENETVTFNLTPNNPAPAAPPTTNYAVSIAAIPVADTRHRYMLQMKPSWMADDNMTIGVSNGFLQLVSLTNTDESLSILSNLTQAAVGFAEFAAVSAGAGPTTTTITNTYHVDFDAPPDTSMNLNVVSNQLSTQMGITLDLSGIGSSKNPSASVPNCTDGVFYRYPVTYYADMILPGGGHQSFPVTLPNFSPIDHVEFERAAFVSQTYILTIHDGVPYQLYLNKPSQAAAIATFPVTVANALLSIPLQLTNLIQARVNIANSQNNLNQANFTLLTNQLQLQQELNALKQRMTNASPATSPGQTIHGTGG